VFLSRKRRSFFKVGCGLRARSRCYVLSRLMPGALSEGLTTYPYSLSRSRITCIRRSPSSVWKMA
jgi:hypothetical protein